MEVPKWRCFNDKEALWRELLKFRYDDFAENFLYKEGKKDLKNLQFGGGIYGA
jgi:hypothetical protein